MYCPPGFVDGEDGLGNSSRKLEGRTTTWVDTREPGWQQQVNKTQRFLHDDYKLQVTCLSRYSTATSEIRDGFNEYFRSQAGELCWQYSHVRRTDVK